MLSLFDNGELVYEVDLKDVLWYSTSYPWKYTQTQWMASGTEENGITLQSGDICCHLKYTLEEKTALLKVVFENIGKESLHHFTAGMSLPVVNPDSKNKVTIPGIIYNDNPSAEPDRIVPHIGNVPGEGIIVEEHRLPIPAVNMEWKKAGKNPFITLLSIPEITDGYDEEYWSLGVIKEQNGERIMSLSGPLMFNGMKDIMYGGRCVPLTYGKGYRTLKPGEQLHKTYALSWGIQEEEGKAFMDMVKLGYEELHPKTIPVHTPEQMIAFKQNVVDSRYHEDAHSIGYLTFGSANSFGNVSGRPEYYLYGWTGQAVKLAFCECMHGLQTQNGRQLNRAMKTIDFFVNNGESNVPGLYFGYYMIDEQSWRGAWNQEDAGLSSRIEGESMSDLLDVMLLLKKWKKEVPAGWEKTVRRACSFLMNQEYQTDKGLYPFEWDTKGKIHNQEVNSAGVSCIVALTKAGEYFEERAYLDYAEKIYARYASYTMETFDIPFAKATMDARCEDKEAGIYFFIAAYELYRNTRKECFRSWGKISAYWILTFVFFWETGFQRGTICQQNDFKTTGWPGVSVQNHHLDVFFPIYEMYDFGLLTEDKILVKMAEHVSDALTHGVAVKEGDWNYSVIGEQGEQYYQTNYFQNPYPAVLKYISNFRGGMQVWNPSWITAQVMSNALKFFYDYRTSFTNAEN